MKSVLFQLSIMIFVTMSLVAQTGSGLDLTHNVIATGGEKSTGAIGGATFSVDGTIGQGVAGTTSNSTSPRFSVRGGFWAFEDLAPTAAGVSIGGRVMTAAGLPINKVRVSLTGSDGIRVALTNAFGYYRFDDVEVGHTYLIEANSKRFEFVPRTIAVSDELVDVDLVALP